MLLQLWFGVKPQIQFNRKLILVVELRFVIHLRIHVHYEEK
jgi:hypothetical protein